MKQLENKKNSEFYLNRCNIKNNLIQFSICFFNNFLKKIIKNLACYLQDYVACNMQLFINPHHQKANSNG